jgi:cell fate regulator YaaT (PSP1 superfamily)
LVRVVGVRFKTAGKVYYFDPADFDLKFGTKIVVETARGIEYGDVVVGPKDVPDEEVVHPLKKVIRIGTPQDAAVAAENKRREREAFGIALKKIQQLNLDMNLVDVEYTFDGAKNIFYFTAEGRIDFRELVRELASIFRTRIEMRQIGVRDEAKLLGGIGPCGRILCCTSFLGDFAPVSIRMAKDQNLSLNPSKISGLCGRLMCCLRFEQDTYEAAKKDPTLAPGYVPPPVPADVADLSDLEEAPVPAIGVRGSFSPRMQQALEERPRRQEGRPGGDERPAGSSGGRPPQTQGGPQSGGQRPPKGQGPSGPPRPRSEKGSSGGARPEGRREGVRPDGARPDGNRQPRPGGGRPEGGRSDGGRTGGRPEGGRDSGRGRQEGNRRPDEGRHSAEGRRPEENRRRDDRREAGRPQRPVGAAE